MMETEANGADLPPSTGKTKTPSGAMGAAGGLVGGVLASSCCLLPLAMVSVGVGGAWMPTLTALSPYQPYFFGLAGVSLAVGFWRVYGANRATACSVDGYCARPTSTRVTKTALWLGVALVLASVGVNVLAPYLI